MIYNLKNDGKTFDKIEIRNRYINTKLPILEIKKLTNNIFKNYVEAYYSDQYLPVKDNLTTIQSTKLFVELDIVDLPDLATTNFAQDYDHKKNRKKLAKIIFSLFLNIPQLEFLEIRVMSNQQLLYHCNLKREELEYVTGELSQYVLVFIDRYQFYISPEYPKIIFSKDFLDVYVRIVRGELMNLDTIG